MTMAEVNSVIVLLICLSCEFTKLKERKESIHLILMEPKILIVRIEEIKRQMLFNRRASVECRRTQPANI